MKTTRIGLFIILGVLILTHPPLNQGRSQITARTVQPPADGMVPPPVPDSAVRTDMNFGRTPVYFISNHGQMDRRVAYYVQGQDQTLYFTLEGLTIALSGKGNPESRSEKTGSRWVVKLEFINPNPGVQVVAEGKTGAVVSYFNGKPAEWKTRIPTYSKIIYQELWPGIDLAYSGAANRLKYELIVRPGADPKAIRLRYRGAEDVRLTGAGRLEVRTPLGSFQDEVPIAYQEAEGGRSSVPVSYLLDEPSHAGERHSEASEKKAAEFVVGFQVGEYDRQKNLVLDPVMLLYCGFIGGSGADYGYGIAVDGSGNAYVTGATDSSAASFPVTVGPDLTFGLNFDAFVAKLNAAGTGLVYCGYIGGSSVDVGAGIAVDASGNAYVTGRTNSTQSSFPALVGPDLTQNGNYDAFITKVNPSGTGLVYSGFLGGAYLDYGNGIAVDSSGNAYITGSTTSTQTTFPVTGGPGLIHGGGDDGFVAKVDASGTALVYCGYVGGLSYDYGYGIALDAAGSAYITGSTSSYHSTFPVTVGPDLSHNGVDDAFVAKVNPTGAALDYCGYVGGSAADFGRGIAVDPAGNAYITGYTYSNQTTFPETVGPDLTYNGSDYDAFVAKVNATGSALSYCGYIGGNAIDYGRAIAVGSSGNAYVAGYTTSTQGTFPETVGPDLTHNGGDDGYVAMVAADGSALVYCGYIGGSSLDQCHSIAVDGSGSAYVTGLTSSTEANFPVLAGPDLTYNAGTYDAFTAKIQAPGERRLLGADIDGDGEDEVVADLALQGLWSYDQSVWTLLSASDPEALVAANVDGDAADEIVSDFASLGAWVWNGGWGQLSGANPDGMAAADTDGDATDEVAVDFGTLGIWIWDGGSWTQLTGSNVDALTAADVDGNGDDEVIVDGGSLGLWVWDSGAWSVMSSLNAEGMTAADTDGSPDVELAVDFGAVGAWLYDGGTWIQLAGANPEAMTAVNVNGAGGSELAADFGSLGVWLYDGSWSQLSGSNPESMIAADLDGSGDEEIVADFGTIGLWSWDSAWSQMSALNAESAAAANIDTDATDELVIDFGITGIWLWNDAAWSQIR